MDPEIVERLNEQLREMFEILSEQNAMMASQMKAMKDQTAASDKITKANNKQSKSNDELAESTGELTKKQEAYARAEKERQEAVQEATDRINKAMGTVANGFLSLGSVIMDSTHSFSKYNGMIGSAGDAALDLGKNFGVLGTVIGGVVKAATMLMQYQLAQADSLLKFNDQISKMGAANAFNTDEILSMANKIGFAAKDLDKLMAPMQKLGSTFKQLGNGAVDSTNRFMEMAKVGSEVRQEFQRLGYSQAELVEAQAGYVELMGGAGLSLRSFNGEMKTLQKTSLAYVKNLQALSEMTGLSVEDQTKRMAAAAADTQFQLYVADMNKKIASASTEEEKQKLAAQVELAMATKAQITALQGEEAGRGYGQALAGAPITEGLGTMAVSGTLGTIQELARETRAGNINSAKDAAKYTQAITDSSAKAQDQLKIAAAISPEAANLVGGTGGITERNRLFGLDQEKAAADIQKRIDDNAAATGKAAEDTRQQVRNTLTETEIALRTAFDSFAGNLGIASTALIGLAGAAGLAALAIAARGGLSRLAAGGAAAGGAAAGGAATGAATTAAAAREASKASTKQAAIDAAKAARAGPGAAAATAATAAAPAAATAGKGAKLLGLAKGGARILGKLAAPLAIGMTAYDAFQGFNADKDAKLGDKLKNAGSSALSGLTFGLLGSSPEEIKARKEAEQAKTPEKTDSKDKSQTATDSKFADAFGKHVEKFGEIVNKLGSTNKGMSSSVATSFGRNVESFGKLVIAFARTVTSFAKIVKAFATVTGTFVKAVKMFADQNKLINTMGTVSSKVKGKSSGLLGTPMGEDSELDVIDYIESLQIALDLTTTSTDNIRAAEMKRHRFTEESMMQFRRSLEDLTKTIGGITGIDRSDDDSKNSSTDGGGGGDGGGDEAGAGSTDNAKKALEYFMEQGWSKNQAAGIVGNLQQESGANLNPRARNPGDAADGSDSVGIAQWNSSRLRNLEKFAKKRGTSSDDFDTQLAFVQYELTQGEKKNVGRALKKTDDVAEAATLIDKRYEVSDGSSIGKRIANARALVSDDRADGDPIDVKGRNKDIISLGTQLQEQGLVISGHSEFGGTPARGVHAENSRHYKDLAIDINAPGGITEADNPKWAKKFNDLASRIQGAGFAVKWNDDAAHRNHIHASVGPPEGRIVKARKGGLVKGPDSGYPVEMHGSEMITPLTQDSILAKLAKTPADTPEISNAMSSTAPTMEKEILERVVNMNAELVEGMLSKLGDMVSAISDGNDTREKILKNSMV